MITEWVEERNDRPDLTNNYKKHSQLEGWLEVKFEFLKETIVIMSAELDTKKTPSKQWLINAFDMSTIGHMSPGQWKVRCHL